LYHDARFHETQFPIAVLHYRKNETHSVLYVYKKQ